MESAINDKKGISSSVTHSYSSRHAKRCFMEPQGAGGCSPLSHA